MIIENMFDFLLQNICSHAIMQENKCSIQEYWEEAKEGIVMKEKKEKKRSMRAYAVYGNTAAAAELILAEDRKRHFTVIAGGKEQNDDCGMATELTCMGAVVSALLGLLETCLIFFGLRLSFSFIPVFSVAVLWASLSILTGAFLELLLSIFD